MGHCHDKVVAGLISEKDLCKIREAVCIQVEKIYDACKEKDCIENAPVLFRNPRLMQCILRKAINVKVRRAEVVDVYADVEPVPFKRGFYTVDIKFFIKVTLDIFLPKFPVGTRIITVPGLVLFDKKVILFGSEGNIKIFKSKYVKYGIDTPAESNLQQDNLPISKVEVAEPIALNAVLADVCNKCCDDCCCDGPAPRSFEQYLEDVEIDESELEIDERHGQGNVGNEREVQVSLGLFSIIKLVRYVQLLIPAFDFCVPNKKCIAATDEDPCVLFDTIDFPVDEFFPPQKFDFPGATAQEKRMLGEEEEPQA